jgi:16S rRNA (guanine527-N7)-methyltransferase
VPSTERRGTKSPIRPTAPPPGVVRLGEPLRRKLERYVEELLRWGAKTNLVGPAILRDPWPAIEEALAARELFPSPPSLLLDIGSGGGLPAIPLAIGWGCPVLLLEPRQKRWAFLVRMLRELEIEGEALDRGWQELLADPGGWRPDAVSCRALGGAREWGAALRPVLASPARLFWFSGPNEEETIDGFVHERTAPLFEPGHLLRVFRTA